MKKGWFAIPGVQAGDRTLEEQLKGLGPLLDEVRGARVLELGCAEGLLLRHCMEQGALEAYGFEVVWEAVEEANLQLAAWPFRAGVWQHDLNQPYDGCRDADIVLLLAILHKLREPGATLRQVARHQPALIVVRLPPATAPVIVDARSGHRPCNVQANLELHGYVLEQVTRGHFDEWCGYFRKAA
jgi:SAM-dependent methyltransferase